MHRQAKILATLGPATDGRVAMSRLLRAGADAVRLNCSHGSKDEIRNRVSLVHSLAAEMGKFIAIILDLQGPKIRIGSFKEGSVVLKKGQQFIFDVKKRGLGDSQSVGVDYSGLAKDCYPKDILLLDDGRLTMKVRRTTVSQVICEVITGGELKSRKGINKKGGGLTAPALTKKDKEDIRFAAELKVDYIAVSFPRSAEDMEQARRLVRRAGCQAQLIAKVERAEAVKNLKTLEALVKASDGAMIARGDLGVEIGDTGLIAMQKNLIAMCRRENRIAITATQMMETMIENPQPTRAEVFDVANAVLDGTDVVMLSAETASGKHPHLVVETMARICRDASSYEGGFFNPLTAIPEKINEIPRALAISAIRMAKRIEGVKALVSLTESGSTVLSMSRINTRIPIYALSRHKATLRRMALYRDVTPLYFEQPSKNEDQAVLNFLCQRRLIKKGDRILLTFGSQSFVSGMTNTLIVLQV